jgi:hypothetical protein
MVPYPNLQNIHHRFDERRRDLRNDCIAVTPQESHAAGKPISQRGRAGFNTPRFSVATGDEVVVGSESMTACSLSGLEFRFIVSSLAWPSLQSRAAGVAQPANCAASFIVSCFFVPLGLTRDSGSELVRPPLPECWSGVGHPVQALPDVRRADARSAQIGGPDGISQCFQVSTYSGEP